MYIVIFSIWIVYKESSWTSAFFWIVLLVSFTGITLCAYILRQLFQLSLQQPAYLIIFNKNRQVY
ncbi:hypothetical protein HanRHA438_Chr15g0717111 [Helianthus annuus]|nr:hypothetical protein HanRHA438_Chr15g0717111 [Helianthus annuus]